MAKKFSQFPSAANISPGDSIVGLKDGANTRFSFATFLSSIQSLFVPTSRKVNNKALTVDITLDASDVGAVDTNDVGVADGVASLDSNGKVPGTQLDLSGKQSTITASGILKGDGQGGVSAATAGTDYGTYSKPSGGIPSTDMTSAVQTSLGKADTAYQKPSSGIPSSDMASGVQTSLGKADTAYQKPSGGIPASDLANGVIPTVPSAYTSDPAMDGTASPGSSGAWAKGDHVHPSDTSRVPVYGLGKNLLDNWYFGNPVNQRGQSSYSGAGYGIDRWRTIQWNTTANLSVSADGVTLSASASGANSCTILQTIQDWESLVGRTLTLSIYTGAVSSGGDARMMVHYGGSDWVNLASVPVNGVKGISFTVPSNATRLQIGFGHHGSFGGTGNLSMQIKAAKLELGTEQTLAHQENGVWVLNEIPYYGEELAKCQRYLYPIFKGQTDYGIYPIIVRSQIVNGAAQGYARIQVLKPDMLNRGSMTVVNTYSSFRLVVYKRSDSSVPATPILTFNNILVGNPIVWLTFITSTNITSYLTGAYDFEIDTLVGNGNLFLSTEP